MLTVFSGCVIKTPQPAPPRDRSFAVSLEDANGQPLVGDVTITFGLEARREPFTVGRVEFSHVADCPTRVRVEAKVLGYTGRPHPDSYGPEQVACGVNADGSPFTARLIFDKDKPPAPPKPVWPPTIARAPLPEHNPDTFESPNEETPKSWHPVYRTVTQVVPSQPDVRWWRGNAWGVTVPGLPAVPGGARPGSPAESRVLTYFLGRYERAKPGMEQIILDAHRAAGYTHVSLSPQDEFVEGMSEDQYVAMAARVKAAGFFVHHLFLSKYYTDHDNPDFSQPFRLMEKLAEVGALDVVTPAWEMNFMQPDVVRRVINAFAAKRDELAVRYTARARLMLHFFPHYIAWQPDGTAPGPWWNENIRVGVDGVLYQGDPTYTMGMLSARLQDAQNRLSVGGAWGVTQDLDLVLWEDQATNQYNNGMTGNGRIADEAEGDLRGLEAIATPGPIPIRGAGNGLRKMDGHAQ